MLVFDQYRAWHNGTVSLVWHIFSGPVRVISRITFAVVQDPVHGTSDMALITPGLSCRDISFSVADDHMGSDHFSIQISLDKPLKRNTH